MDVKGLHDILKKRVDDGYGGDEIVVYDEDGASYGIVTAEANDDDEMFEVNIELS